MLIHINKNKNFYKGNKKQCRYIYACQSRIAEFTVRFHILQRTVFFYAKTCQKFYIFTYWSPQYKHAPIK